MALLGSTIPGEVGLRLLLSPLGSNVVIRTACCAVGIGLPIYSTFKAIESKNQNEQDKWLVYWAAYGSFSLVEVFTDKLISGLPFYYHIKLAFLVWLQLPSNNGSKHLYVRYLRPFLLKHQVKLDRLLSFLSAEINKFMSAHQGEIHFFKAVAVRCALSANQLVKDMTQTVQIKQQNAIEGPDSAARQQASHSDSD